jgi:hypothetical protein
MCAHCTGLYVCISYMQDLLNTRQFCTVTGNWPLFIQSTTYSQNYVFSIWRRVACYMTTRLRRNLSPFSTKVDVTGKFVLDVVSQRAALFMYRSFTFSFVLRRLWCHTFIAKLEIPYWPIDIVVRLFLACWTADGLEGQWEWQMAVDVACILMTFTYTR